jgi:hypothetical protein
MTALGNQDADATKAALSAYAQPDTLAIAQARRYVEAEEATIRFADAHLWFSDGKSVTLLILLIHVIGAAIGDVKDEKVAAQAAEARFRVIGFPRLVSHMDSAAGHTVVLVLYRPGAAAEAKVQALGAVATRVEFYPVACCVSLDSATRFFGRSTLPYRQRLVGGDVNTATLASLKALGVGEPPDTDGTMSVIDPHGSMIAHWNGLPDASELRETLH